MEKKLIALIIASALVGGAVGSFLTTASFTAASESASLRDVLHGFFERWLPSLTESSPEREEAYVPIADFEEKIISAVERAEPGVVSVIVSKLVPVIEQCPYDPFADLPPEFRPFFGGGTFTVPCERGAERQEVGGGSGFVIENPGMEGTLIATNKHVVGDTKADYTVLTNDGKKHEAEVLARDPILDLAILQIDATGLTPLALGDSASTKLGQTVIAIGNALGEFRNTVSVGVISGLARNVTAHDGASVETIEGVLQTDAAINPGNSGGPLLNLKGEVIGINTAVASGAENIGFAIAINQAKRAISSIQKHGRIIVPYLGVRYRTLTAERAETEGLSVTYGALIRGDQSGPAVMPDSPADKAGIKAEDVVLSVDGIKVTESRSLASLIQEHQVEDTITIKVLREGVELDLAVTLEERPNL